MKHANTTRLSFEDIVLCFRGLKFLRKIDPVLAERWAAKNERFGEGAGLAGPCWAWIWSPMAHTS